MREHLDTQSPTCMLVLQYQVLQTGRLESGHPGVPHKCLWDDFRPSVKLAESRQCMESTIITATLANSLPKGVLVCVYKLCFFLASIVYTFQGHCECVHQEVNSKVKLTSQP